MVTDVMEFINTALAGCSDLFVRVFVGSKMAPVFFAFLSVYLAVRFLLVPIFGSAKSDLARRSGDKGDNDE